MAADTKERVLEVLAGQSPGYLIHPTASAFLAAGLSPDEVEAALAELEQEGHALLTQEVGLRYVVEPLLDEEGEHRTDAAGAPLMQRKLDDDGEPLTEIDTDDEGNEVVHGEGWEITGEGKKLALKRRKS